MNRQEFIYELRKKMSRLSEAEVEERICFYEEMISDRMEDGLSEEEAIDTIKAIEISNNVPLYEQKSHLTINKTKQNDYRRRKKIIILSSTAIIWAPILIVLAASAFAIAVSLYATLWSVVASIWAVFGAFTVSAPAAALIGTLNIFSGNILFGIAIIGGGMVCAGLAIFTFFGALYTTKGSAILTKKSFSGIIDIIKNRR